MYTTFDSLDRQQLSFFRPLLWATSLLKRMLGDLEMNLYSIDHLAFFLPRTKIYLSDSRAPFQGGFFNLQTKQPPKS